MGNNRNLYSMSAKNAVVKNALTKQVNYKVMTQNFLNDQKTRIKSASKSLGLKGQIKTSQSYVTPAQHQAA